MTTGHAAILRALLHRLRPEANLAALPGDADLREELDLDSMDFLNFVIALSEGTGVEVPEADYAHLATVEDCVAYLDRHAPAS